MHIILFFILTISFSCAADEISLSNKDSLYYVVPDGFDLKISDESDAGFKTVLDFAHFNEQGVKDFGYKIYPHKVDASILTTDKEIEELLRFDCEKHKASSVEQEVMINKYSGGNDVLICSFTDKRIAADAEVPLGEFRNISIAFVKENNFAFTIVVYSNELSGELFDELLATLFSLKVNKI